MQPNLIHHQFNGLGKEPCIKAMKLHHHFEFGPASQDPFSFCQIQLALDTVYDYVTQLNYGHYVNSYNNIKYGEIKVSQCGLFNIQKILS